MKKRFALNSIRNILIPVLGIMFICSIITCLFISDDKNLNFFADKAVANEEETLEFLYMDQPDVSLGETEKIYVSFYNNLYAKNSKLNFHSENNIQESISPSYINDDLALFEITYDDDSYLGKYYIDSISWAGIDPGFQVIEPSNKGYSFSFNKKVDNMDSEELPAGIYDIRGDGDITKENKLDVDSTQMLLTSAAENYNNESNRLRICLDPGHGGNESGACYGGLVEKDINLQIALACRNELRQYNGVEVIMTRDTDTTLGLQDRCIIAKNYGCDLFVSFHNNAGWGNGAEVWVQYGGCSWHNEFNSIGTDIANKILDKLCNGMGLAYRGVKSDVWDGRTYPNGAIGDYFAVLFWSRNYEIPGILIEHAFIDGDYGFLCNNNNLVNMGINDATAIAKHYGLSKDAPSPYVDNMFDCGLTLKWDKVSGAEKYAVAKVVGKQFINYTTDLKTNSYTINGLTNGEKYTFLVQAWKNGHWSDFTEFNYLGVRLLPCPKVTWKPTGDGQITFTWNKLTGVSKYAVALCDDGQFYTYDKNITQFTYTVDGLENGVTQKFLIQGYFDNCKQWSTYESKYFVSVVPEGKEKPEPFIKDSYYHSLVVTWEPVSGATDYAIATKNPDGSFKTYTYGCTDTKYTISGLKENTEYQILVQAHFKHDRWSKYTSKDIIKAKTKSSAPEVTSVIDGDGTCNLTWNKVDGAEKYAVVESVNGTLVNVDTNIVSKADSITYEVNNLANGYKHLLLVQSYVEGSWSSWEKKYFVESYPQGHTKPWNINAVGGARSISLNWDAVPGADKYAIAIFNSPSSYTTYTKSCKDTNYVINGLESGKTYKVLIQCCIYGIWSSFQYPGDLVSCTTTNIKPVVEVVNTGDGSVTLKWKKIDSTTKYAVSEKENGVFKNFTTTLTSEDDEIYYTVNNLPNNYYHLILVQSFIGGSWSSFNDADFKRVKPTGTVKPTNIKWEGGTNTVKLTWDHVPGAQCYAVSAWDSPSKYQNFTTSCTNETYTIKNLELGKTYHILVQAKIYGIWSNYNYYTDLVDVTTTDTRPKPYYIGQKSGEVTFGWHKVENATKYAIAEKIDGYYKTIDKDFKSTDSDITYTVTNLANGYKHTFLVQAFVGGIWSPADSMSFVSGTPQGPTKPKVISSQSEINSVTLYWEAIPGAEKYTIASQVGKEGYTTYTYDCLDTSYCIKEIRPKLTYNFVVQAFIMGKWTDFTSTDLWKAEPLYDPSRPYPVVDKTEIGKIYLHWDPIPNAQFYAIARQSGNQYINFDTEWKGTEFVCQGGLSGGEYRILVQAFINGKWSSFDNGDLVSCDVPFSSGTRIMHNSRTTINQMINYFNSSGHSYRNEYSKYGAPDLKTFCTICYQEATDEGVDPAVLFCQAMHETGWLGFGGDVQWWQCNFGGIGATDIDPHPATFKDVRTGLRAQVQHLKAYGSRYGELVHPLVDPRFDLVERGICPNVEDLGGHWASGSQYGYAIVESMERLSMQPR